MSNDVPLEQQSATTLALLLQFHAAFNSHDVDAIMGLMNEDCIFENTYPAPDGARVVGQQAVREVWEALFSASPHAVFLIEDAFAAADRGVIRWRYIWNTESEPAGHIRGVDIFRVRDGKVAEKLSYVKG